MTRTAKLITGGVIAAALAAGGVVGTHLHYATATATVPVATGTATTATPTVTTAATAPTPAAVTVPEVGATVPADQVTAVRAAGGHVYVSPNGSGDGLVVAAGLPLPPVMVTDWAATGAGQVAATSDAETNRSKAINAMLRALVDLNVPVVSITSQGSFKDGKLIEQFWAVGIDGVPNYYDINKSLGRQQTHAAATATAQKLASQYGAQVIDVG